MTEAILLSIKPEYSTKIFSGTKRFELRRRAPKVTPKWVLIYESSPTKRLVGFAGVEEVMKKNVCGLWEYTKDANGVSKEEFFSYFSGLDEGFAIKLKDPKLFKEDWNLDRLRNEFSFSPPQNFCFPDDELFKTLKVPQRTFFQLLVENFERIRP